MSERLGRQEVLYMFDNGPKQCGRCMMYLPDVKKCSIIGEAVDQEDGVCGLYVHGDPMPSSSSHRPIKLVSKKTAGYGADAGVGGYACGNCRYGSGSPTCRHPALLAFPIDNAGGCCNAWEYGPHGSVVPYAKVKKQYRA